MTVKELRDELNKLIDDGKENLSVQVSFYEEADDYYGGDVYYDIDGVTKFDNYIELEKSWSK